MRTDVRIILKFRHGAPVPFGHVRHAELLVFARFNGYGVIETSPKAAITCLDLIRPRHFELIERYDPRYAAAVKQRLAVCAVVDEKRFITVSFAEVMPKQRENTVFGFNFRAQYAIEL